MIEIQIGTKRSTKLDAIHLLMSLSKPNYSIIIEKNFIFMELLRRCSLHYMIYSKLTPALTIDAIKINGFHDDSFVSPSFKEVTSILPWSLSTDSTFVYHKRIDIFPDSQVEITHQSSLLHHPLETDGQWHRNLVDDTFP